MGDIGNFDVSKVTSMKSMFQHAEQFNQELEYWDTSNVEDMGSMFRLTKNFNKPLERWNVSKVTNMYKMFGNAEKFDQPLARWNVSSVTSMFEMFRNAFEFNSPVEFGDISNVSAEEMTRMFHGATAFRQCLATWGNGWDSNNPLPQDMFVNTKCPKDSNDKTKPWCCSTYYN